MAFILRRNEDGKFVAPPGQEHSYTVSPIKARRFNSREEAEREKCGNETVQIFEDWASWTPLKYV